MEESNCLNTIEKYNPKTGSWIPFSALPRMMCGSGMQVLDSVPLSLAYPSRKRKALYVDSGQLAGGQLAVPMIEIADLEGLDIPADSDGDVEGATDIATIFNRNDGDADVAGGV